MLASNRTNKLIARKADFDDLLRHQLWYPELIDISPEVYAERACNALETNILVIKNVIF